MKRLFIVRPEPGASATAESARELGLDCVVRPIFEVKPLEWDLPNLDGFDALLLTSANAIRFGGEKVRELRGLPVHAVGDATAAAAREAGFDIASSGSAGVERLLGSIEQDLRLLHLCGKHRHGPGEVRRDVTSLAVYTSESVQAPDLLGIEHQLVAAHSPRAAARLSEVLPGDVKRTVTLAAISDAAAEAGGNGWASVASSDAPRDDALLALAKCLCED